MKFRFCVACLSEKDLHHHHLVPKVRGGSDDERNLITLCQACHALIHQTKEWTNHNALTREGMRKAKENKKVYTNSVYGFDVKDGKMIKNKKEQATIRMMKKWEKQGWEWQRIATELNNLGIKTKKGVEWHRSTIRRMMIRIAKESQTKS